MCRFCAAEILPRGKFVLAFAAEIWYNIGRYEEAGD